MRSICWLFVIFSFTLAGCAQKNAPKVTPDKKAQIKAEAQVSRNEYFNKLRSAGCGGEKIKKPVGALKEHKKKMLERYGFLLAPQGYKEESRILDSCPTVEAIDKFFEVFWSIRDPDKTTPEEEYKEIIDKRIADVQNEVFFQDAYIPGTLFAANGGLRGDMAHVYILRGEPSYKVKVENLSRLSDLMAWVYFDVYEKPLFVFLFYNKGSGYRVFDRHSVINTNAGFMETLREIARFHPMSEDDYVEIYRELIYNDPEYIFRFALQNFSYYPDVNIGKVMAPPLPEHITAEEIQPRILGIPKIPEGMIQSPYHAKITGVFRIKEDTGGNYKATFEVVFSDFDWESNATLLDGNFDIFAKFTNQETGETTDFISGLVIKIPEAYYKRKESFPLDLSDVKNRESGTQMNVTLADMIKNLKPGNYEIKLNLINQKTLKSGVWYEYITIKK